MRFQVFLSGLVCALLASQEAASAASLDQLGADHLASLDDATTFAQESDPTVNQRQTETKPEKKTETEQPQLKKMQIDGGPGSVYKPVEKAKHEEKLKKEDKGGDDCHALAKAAGECVGGKRGGKDADDKQKDKDKKDTEDKNTRDSYYWQQQEHIRRTNQENATRQYWEQYNATREEEERIRKEKYEQEITTKTEEHKRKLIEEREEKDRQY